MVPPIGKTVYLSASEDNTSSSSGTSQRIGDGLSMSYEVKTVMERPMASLMTLEEGGIHYSEVLVYLLMIKFRVFSKIKEI